MTDFATLKSDVALYMARSDLDTTIPTFVRLCESRIRKTVRIPEMETTDDLALAAQTVALPAGFIAMRRIYSDSTTDRPLEYQPPEICWSDASFTTPGAPIAYTIEGTNLSVFPYAANYVAKINYWKAFNALSGDADTNWLLTNAYDVYLYGTLMEAKAFIEDDAQVQKWTAAFETAVTALNEAGKRQRRGPVLRKMGVTAP